MSSRNTLQSTSSKVERSMKWVGREDILFGMNIIIAVVAIAGAVHGELIKESWIPMDLCSNPKYQREGGDMIRVIMVYCGLMTVPYKISSIPPATSQAEQARREGRHRDGTRRVEPLWLQKAESEKKKSPISSDDGADSGGWIPGWKPWMGVGPAEPPSSHKAESEKKKSSISSDDGADSGGWIPGWKPWMGLGPAEPPSSHKEYQREGGDMIRVIMVYCGLMTVPYKISSIPPATSQAEQGRVFVYHMNGELPHDESGLFESQDAY
ncbi:hypothetical protein OSTOST_02717 [Ostertagia ostertagi]